MSKPGQTKFDQIFLEYYDILYQYGMKVIQDDYIVQECIQELFLYLYEKKTDIDTIKYIKSYLIKSVRRRLIEKQKASKKQIELTAIYFKLTDFQADEEEDIKKKQELITLLNQLPWGQREVICLKFFNNLSGKEIAEIMNIKPQVVSNIIYKTLKKIRDTIGQLPLLSITVSYWVSFFL